MTGIESHNFSVTVTFDSSYPSKWGRTFDATAYVKNTNADRVTNESTALGYVVRYDATNKKLKVFNVPALDGNAASAQALAEVANTTNLSTLSVDLIISGGRA